MEKNNAVPGLSERVLREVMATPALKELVLMQMKDIRPEAAPGLMKTLLWGDPGISMSLFGVLPDAVNWLLELLLELGRQLNGLPEPLMKDILGQVGAGIDLERLGQFPEVYGQLIRRLIVGEGKTPEEMRAAAIGALNNALAGLDRLTAKLDENRADIARSMSRDIKALDTAALARSMRRIGLLAVTAARPGKEGGGKAPRAALAAAAGFAGLLVLRIVIRKARGY